MIREGPEEIDKELVKGFEWQDEEREHTCSHWGAIEDFWAEVLLFGDICAVS